jgi:hypothetical protein
VGKNTLTRGKLSHVPSTIDTTVYSKYLIDQNIGRWMTGHKPTPNPSQEGNTLTAQVKNFLLYRKNSLLLSIHY